MRATAPRRSETGTSTKGAGSRSKPLRNRSAKNRSSPIRINYNNPGSRNSQTRKNWKKLWPPMQSTSSWPAARPRTPIKSCSKSLTSTRTKSRNRTNPCITKRKSSYSKMKSTDSSEKIPFLRKVFSSRTTDMLYFYYWIDIYRRE